MLSWWFMLIFGIKLVHVIQLEKFGFKFLVKLLPNLNFSFALASFW